MRVVLYFHGLNLVLLGMLPRPFEAETQGYQIMLARLLSQRKEDESFFWSGNTGHGLTQEAGDVSWSVWWDRDKEVRCGPGKEVVLTS